MNQAPEIDKMFLLRVANDGVMGGVGDKAVQCVCGGFGMVPRTHGRRHLVADAGE